MNPTQIIRFKCQLCYKEHETKYEAEACCTDYQKRKEKILSHELCPICIKPIETHDWGELTDTIEINKTHKSNYPDGGTDIETAAFHEKCCENKKVSETIKLLQGH